MFGILVKQSLQCGRAGSWHAHDEYRFFDAFVQDFGILGNLALDKETCFSRAPQSLMEGQPTESVESRFAFQGLGEPV